jgi:alpha-aminoadipate/glutamate carrier protein LysW
LKAECTECGAAIPVPDDVIVGEIVSCKECAAEYEVAEISNGAALLKAAEKVGEDWGE